MKGRILLHLLATAAGWGIVAALRPVVASWQVVGEAAVESRAHSKTGRVRSTAEVAAGQKLLQRITAARQEDSGSSEPSLTLSIKEMVDGARRDSGFDPAAPAPPSARNDEIRSPKEKAAAAEYNDTLTRLLRAHLSGAYGPDLAHAFRHGQLDADELYNSLTAQLPGAAVDDTLRIALYHQLAPLDPARAAAILQPLSDAEATDVKYEAFADLSTAFTPDTALALLSEIPPARDDSGMFQRELVWINGTTNFHHYYGSDYLPWVEQLPAGTDRDLAAVALLNHLQESDLPGYRRIRSLVTDPGKLDPFPPR